MDNGIGGFAESMQPLVSVGKVVVWKGYGGNGGDLSDASNWFSPVGAQVSQAVPGPTDVALIDSALMEGGGSLPSSGTCNAALVVCRGSGDIGGTYFGRVVFREYTYLIGTVNGLAVFRDYSNIGTNGGTVYGSVELYDSSSIGYQGYVYGSVFSFNSNSIDSYATISGLRLVVNTGALEVAWGDGTEFILHANKSIAAVHKASDGTASVADGTYTVGKGSSTDGTITIKDGVITSVQEASN
jgi:hypothetical protein